MKKRSSRFMLILTIAAAVAISVLAPQLLDRLFAPWAFENDGRPALTGSWVGSLATATGKPRGVVLEIILSEPKGRGGLVRDWRSAPYGEFDGTARMCDERGQVRSYTIEGEPKDRHATHLSFYTSPVETPAPEGLTSDWVNGAWDGANTLNLTVDFHWEQDGAAISGGSYPDTEAGAALLMTRGGDAEFQAICARVQQAGSADS